MGDDGEELAGRLESFRNYLLLLARARLDGRLRGRLDPADLVQQTLTRAFERRDQFHGTTDEQRAGWLRTLLAHAMTGRRCPQGSPGPTAPELSLEAALDPVLGAARSVPGGRPSSAQRLVVERQEGLLRLANALAALPDDQQRAVELKHLQGLALVEVARLMGRSVPSVAASFVQRDESRFETIWVNPGSQRERP